MILIAVCRRASSAVTGLIALTRKVKDNSLKNEYHNFKIVEQGNQIL